MSRWAMSTRAIRFVSHQRWGRCRVLRSTFAWPIVLRHMPTSKSTTCRFRLRFTTSGHPCRTRKYSLPVRTETTNSLTLARSSPPLWNARGGGIRRKQKSNRKCDCSRRCETTAIASKPRSLRFSPRYSHLRTSCTSRTRIQRLAQRTPRRSGG